MDTYYLISTFITLITRAGRSRRYLRIGIPYIRTLRLLNGRLIGLYVGYIVFYTALGVRLDRS